MKLRGIEFVNSSSNPNINGQMPEFCIDELARKHFGNRPRLGWFSRWRVSVWQQRLHIARTSLKCELEFIESGICRPGGYIWAKREIALCEYKIIKWRADRAGSA